jgi:hypothetical protein
MKQCSSMRALGRTAALHPEPDIVRQPKPLDRLAGSLRLNPQNSLTRYWRKRDSNYLRAVDRRVCRKVVRADPSCRIPAEDSWRTSAAAPSPNDIRSALAKTQHKMAPSVRLLRVPGTKGSNLSSSSDESGANLSRAGIRLSRSRSHDRALGLEPRQLAPVRRQRRYIDALPVSLQSEAYSSSPFVKHGAGG